MALGLALGNVILRINEELQLPPFSLSLSVSFTPFSLSVPASTGYFFLKIIFAVLWHGGIDEEVGVTPAGPHTLSPSTCDPFTSTWASPTPEVLSTTMVAELGVTLYM